MRVNLDQIYCTTTISSSIIKLQTLMTLLKVVTYKQREACISAKWCYTKKTQPRFNQIGPIDQF